MHSRRTPLGVFLGFCGSHRLTSSLPRYLENKGRSFGRPTVHTALRRTGRASSGAGDDQVSSRPVLNSQRRTEMSETESASSSRLDRRQSNGAPSRLIASVGRRRGPSSTGPDAGSTCVTAPSAKSPRSSGCRSAFSQPPLTRTPAKRCTFCGKGRAQVSALASTADVAICTE